MVSGSPVSDNNFDLMLHLHRFKRTVDTEAIPRLADWADNFEQNYALKLAPTSYLSNIYWSIGNTVSNVITVFKDKFHTVCKNIIDRVSAFRRNEPPSGIISSVSSGVINTIVDLIVRMISSLETVVTNFLDTFISDVAVELENNIGLPRNKLQSKGIFGNITSVINTNLKNIINRIISLINTFTAGIFKNQTDSIRAILFGLINRIFPATATLLLN